ncbi:MAG: hypothetical protein M3303_05485 [Gemmatimonadota bacterium]|nr:hypothetical protein [Gemmatimonadota bacterium]
MPAAERAAGPGDRLARVHRADRIRDWVAVALVVLGVAVYGTAQRGMGAVARDRTPTTAEASARGEWKMVQWNRYQRMSRAGILLVAAGAAVGIWSFTRHAARRARAPHAS